MFRTLYAKLSLALIALLSCVAIFYTLLSFSSANYYLQQTGQQLNLNLAKNLVADRQLVEAGQINKPALSAIFMEYMVINPSIELYLLDLDGNIQSYSADPGKVKRKSVSLAPIHAFLAGEKLPLLGDDPRSHEGKKIFSVTPIPAQHPTGYLYVVLLGEQYDNAEKLILESLLWKQTGLALFSSLLIGLALGLILFKKLTRRLDHLSNDMDNFRNNDFSNIELSTAKNNSDDEIDRLNNTFSQMAQRLMEQFDTLKQQDSLRRELIANVSHDLRTPVAILHGYLETLNIKADQLNQQERQQYTHQALQSSERLSHLITELFELAKLDAHETVPHKEHFNLTELAHDVLQKFALQAKEKHIKLSIHTDDHPIFAYADIALIARVFENLLGNALKFTPAQESVEIQLAESNKHSIVRVINSGPGIAADELDSIFERFYQGEKNSNRSKPGGLGLAIAKRIMILHSGEISVESTPRKSTVFTVTLPREANAKRIHHDQ